MATRKYGSDALKDRDSSGQLPPEELTDAEIAARISEKIELQKRMQAERGTKHNGPTAKPVALTSAPTPAEQAEIDAELLQVRADMAALEAAEQEARKAEADILAKADRERKDRRTELLAHAEEIQKRASEVEARSRAARLAELAGEHAGAAARNAKASEATLDTQRAEMSRLFSPILAEIKATMAEGQAFMQEHGPALERLAAQTFSTADSSFPIRIRQKLSSDVYRPSERLLEAVNVVLACGSAGGDPRWDVVLENSIRAGKIISPEGMTLTMQYARAFCRDHVESWKRQLAQITDRLETLTRQGKEQAGARPEIVITISDHARQEAKRDMLTKSLTSGLQQVAEMGGPVIPRSS
jgi:hypothetical protein